MFDFARLQSAYEKAKADLLAERTPDGHWVGELSSSALATATAVSALAVVKAATIGRGSQAINTTQLDDFIRRGVRYLITQQNADGGFGDTDLSHSNIATTYLVIAALHLAGVADQHAELLKRAHAYVDSKGRLDGLRERYGIDKTFVVPIMTNLALARLVDWKEIDPLPFELACVPQSWYRFVGMPVVSYAIPALVAIGQARYYHAPPRNPFTGFTRWLSLTRSLRVLRRMQPDSGGYLEATPLTSFVVMSLASLPKPRPSVAVPTEDAGSAGTATTGRGFEAVSAEVIREGVKFLINSIRPDGSWPIDTNLATWNTTLAINALAGAGEDVAELLSSKPRPLVALPSQSAGSADSATTGRGFESVLDWLLSCQHTKRHPFTGADPGGFGWSDLSGAVPDADDTPGALLTLGYFATWAARELPTDWTLRPRIEVRRRSQYWMSIESAMAWIEGLQNRDGGWPTFCRGWGRLPFDRSGSDLTAHVIRGLVAFPPERRYGWKDEEGNVATPHAKSIIDFSPSLQSRRETHAKIVSQGLRFLSTRQAGDGSWSPLWFGNQDHPEEDNPVYGTAKVLMAYRDLELMDSPEAQRGVAWLVANQNEDGGWGSGVWQMRNAEFGLRNEERARSAELGARSGVEGEDSVTDLAASGHSVLSTSYSALGTGQTDTIPAPICNLQLPITNLQSSIEETSLAVEALLAAVPRNATEGVPYSASSIRDPRSPTPSSAAARGLAWLIDRVEAGEHRQPAPIGFYFAKLWYYEKLYPLTFTVAALGRACRQFAHLEQLDSHADQAPARAP